MIQAFLDEQDEFKFSNVYLEYTCYPEPYFYVVKECDKDPQLCNTDNCFPVKAYMDEYHERWMRVMIEDICNEIEKNLEKTPLDLVLEDIRHKVFEIGKPQMKTNEE